MPLLIRLCLSVLCAGLALPATAAGPTSGRAPNAPGRVVVTLISSFDPVPDNMVPTDIRDLHVYRTQNQVFGKTIYFVRVGFFTTTAEADAVRTRLLPRFPAAMVTEITPDELAQATGPKRPPAPAPEPSAPKTTAPPARTASPLFTVTLTTGVGTAPAPRAPLPAALADKRMYLLDSIRNGNKVTTLNLGFFASQSEARQAVALLRTTYPRASVRGASDDERRRSAQRVTAFVPPKPLPARPAKSAPIRPAATDASLEQRATELMDKARAALTRGDNAAALSLLDQLLKLPPNRQSQEAQELVGVARERNREIAKARREYALYLRLYPEGEGTERVRQRLANLAAPAPAPKLKAARKRNVDVTTLYGSFSQYYYRGDSKLDTTTTVGTVIDKATLTTTDQSALISSLDLTGRMRRGDWDNRVVVRETYTANFLENTENQNRLYAAYAEVRNKTSDYGGRIGRQSGNSGGLPARYDGLNLGYGILPKWRVNLAAGKPVEFSPINSEKRFWGTSLDAGTFAEHWNGSLYYFQQTVDEIPDRQAAGGELRYFRPDRTLLLLTDYDVSYEELNIAMLQFTQMWFNKLTVNLLTDYRRAPLLSTANAVIGEPDTSIQSQLLTLDEEQLRRMALDKTPIAKLGMLGLNYNLSATWQIGGDIKMYNIGSTPASGSMPASPGSGDVFVYTLQGIASGLLSKRDISVLSLSYLSSDSYDGASFGFNNRTLFQDHWTLDTSLRYYTQQDTAGVDLARLAPLLRLGYRWRQSLTLEIEYGVEKTTTESATTTDVTTSQFFMLGYRWDF